MNVLSIIEKKVQKQELSGEEIAFFIKGYLDSTIKEYQVSALLMAILFNGMTKKETSYLTNEMRNSGEIIDLSPIKGIVVDKHSTGGVGDKISLIIAPIIASLGGVIAKMSGRGLGFTGGTIDKLETIKGFHTSLTPQKFINIINKNGLAIISQSKNITPADKKLYALRDATGTVNSMPLIVSSIMSKKLATGSDAILLDVKCGNGAFMKNIEMATELANNMILVGKSFNKDVRAYITNMSTPLGRAIGNKIEVIEAIEALKGNAHSDLHELATHLAATSLIQGKIFKNKEIALKEIEKSILSGKALDKFYEFIRAQNGDVSYLKSNQFFNPKYKYEIKSTKSGYMKILSAINFGVISGDLGAGRKTIQDKIDPDAGIYLNKKTGEKVEKNDVVITLFSSNPIDKNLISKTIENFEIINKKEKNKIILKELG
jgi:pyrimidine-nucleoside phosphorylase